MPKNSNTRKQRKAEALNRLTVDHMKSKTAVFKKIDDGTKQLDPDTVKYIQESLSRYLKSWVIPELEDLLSHIK